MRDVLVTGGNGFIGQYVVEHLVDKGYNVAVLDRMAVFHGKPNVPEGARRAYFGDIKDSTLVSEAVSHIDGVIHLAGVLGTQETIENPRPAAETNILGGLNVIEACAQYDVPLVNIAVGNYWMNNTYSITKSTIERFVKMTAKYRGKVMASVRALNAYGPRQVPVPPYGPSRVRKIMPSFICRALTGEPIEIYGDGMQVMDMIHVRDVARILVATLEKLDRGEVFEETVEAGTGRHTTVNDIAALIVDAVKSYGVEGRITHLPMRPGEDERSIVVADPETMRQVGVDPEWLTMLEEGVVGTTEYFYRYLEERKTKSQ